MADIWVVWFLLRDKHQTTSNSRMHEHITSLMQIQSGVCLFPAVFASCVCESMLRLPRASTREFKRTLYSSFSLLLNNNHRAVVPPRTSYVLSSACSRVRTHKTNKHVRLYTRWHTPTQSNPHAQNPAHIPPSRGITVQSQPLFLRGKTCFIISFHFFRLRFLSPSPLPPSAFSLSNM